VQQKDYFDLFYLRVIEILCSLLMGWNSSTNLEICF